MLINCIIRDAQPTLFAIIYDIHPGIQNSVFVDNTAEFDRLTAACYKNAVHYYERCDKKNCLTPRWFGIYYFQTMQVLFLFVSQKYRYELRFFFPVLLIVQTTTKKHSAVYFSET
jgi:hypothetical protein